MEKNKTCCFIGHSVINDTVKLRNDLRSKVERLITTENVSIFAFGTRGEFIKLSHMIVSDLKNTHPHIKRVQYSCSFECASLEKRRAKDELEFEQTGRRWGHPLYMEENRLVDTYDAGRASYIARNKKMIDDSDYCVFYYNENYLPPRKKFSKKHITYYQPQSGTHLAYLYAKQKKKKVINILDKPSN